MGFIEFIFMEGRALGKIASRILELIGHSWLCCTENPSSLNTIQSEIAIFVSAFC